MSVQTEGEPDPGSGLEQLPVAQLVDDVSQKGSQIQAAVSSQVLLHNSVVDDAR